MAAKALSGWMFGSSAPAPASHGVENVEEDADTKSTQKAIPTIYDVPALSQAIRQENEGSADAARSLYQLCDVGHPQNRVTLVCSGKYDVITPLIQALTTEDDEKLHFVCLCLNNLSIPDDNKRIMAMERGLSKKLFGNLSKVIAKQKEAYLCCICLMNLSFLEECIPSILQYVPPKRLTEKRKKPIEHPESMLCVLDDLIKRSSPGTSEFRWGLGLLASLARDTENATMIGQTSIPAAAMKVLRETKNPKSNWKDNSTEDFALFLVMRLAESSSPEMMEKKDEIIEMLKPLLVGQDGGVQYLKATMTCAFLEAPWETFPKYGIPAAACISELMGNTFERQGKKNAYANHVFKLSTATKAYFYLAESAAANNEESGSDSNTKVVALPTAVALLFQIVSDVALDAVNEEDDSYTPDERAAEYAVGAMLALMPTLLKAEQPRRESKQSERACLQLRNVLLKFTKKIKSRTGKERAKEALESFKEAPNSAMPILEASYELWIQYNS